MSVAYTAADATVRIQTSNSSPIFWRETDPAFSSED
jgi:hypothetical protein